MTLSSRTLPVLTAILSTRGCSSGRQGLARCQAQICCCSHGVTISTFCGVGVHAMLGKPKWPLLHGHWKMAQKTISKKHPDRFRAFSACFRWFSTVFAIFARFRTFLGGCVSDRFGRPFLHFFAPFACCHLAAAIWIPLKCFRPHEFSSPRKINEQVWRKESHTSMQWRALKPLLKLIFRSLPQPQLRNFKGVPMNVAPEATTHIGILMLGSILKHIPFHFLVHLCLGGGGSLCFGGLFSLFRFLGWGRFALR